MRHREAANAGALQGLAATRPLNLANWLKSALRSGIARLVPRTGVPLMHDTAMEIGCLVMNRYSDLPKAKVLELGSYDVNGSLRIYAPETTEYVGLDLEAGPGVDFVVEPGKPWPVEDDYFDLVLASSVFEHDPMFWLTFLQMVKKARTDGFIYVSAPSNGSVHRYPEDHWRFYPDSGLALERWAVSQGEPVVLVESFTAGRKGDEWNDFVAVFRKGKSRQSLPKKFVYQQVRSFNALTWNKKELINPSTKTEDMLIIDEIRTTVHELDEKFARVEWENQTNWNERQKAESELLLIGARLSQEQTGHEASRKQIIELSASLERHRIDLETAAARLSEHAYRIREEEIANGVMKEELAKREAMLSDVNGRLTTNELEISELREEVLRRGAALSAAEEVHARLESDYHEMEAKVRTTTEELAQLQERHALSVSTLSQRDEEIEQTRLELDRARSERLLALEEKEKLQARLAEADSWTFKLAGERKHWEMQAQRAARALDQLHAELGAESRRLAEKLCRSEADLRAERAAKFGMEAELAASLAAKEELARALELLQADLGQRDAALHASKVDLEQQVATNAELLEQMRQQAEVLQATVHARDESEQKLAKRYEEVAQLTAILAQEGSSRAATMNDNNWLRDMVMTAARMPHWWSWLPTKWRRSREHAFYRRAGLFDAVRYLEIHPDVAQDGMDPVRHYIMHGMSEGRERPH